MAYPYLDKSFPDKLREKGFSDEQIETVLEILAQDPGFIAIAGAATMDLQARRERGRP